MQRRLNQIRAQNGMEQGGELQQIGCVPVAAGGLLFSRRHCEYHSQVIGVDKIFVIGYELDYGEGLRVWRECQERAASLAAEVPVGRHVEQPAKRWGKPALVIPRLGQGTFRVAVTEAYARACAVTGEHSLPALEAAHIRPFAVDGPHDVSNGLLLRSDVHRLFDRGYITVTPDGRLNVSKQLKEHFHNGRSYYPLHGARLSEPKLIAHRPNRELLRWHNDNRFLD